MGLNPSNGIAARANPGKTMFRNLARRIEHPFSNVSLPETEASAVFKEVDNAVRAELVQAGILNSDGTGDRGNWMEADWVRKVPGGSGYNEVPCSILVAKYRWTFTRAWYYYIAKGPGIPPDAAEEFHKAWGTQVRVDGHCGCPSPLEWEKGFAVGMYHIDTQEGLTAFVELLKSIYRG